VPAFRAPEEPDFAFISRPQLTQPPECEVIVALRAPDLDGGKRPYLPALFNNDDVLFAAFLLTPHLFLLGIVNFFYIPASPALELAPRRHQHGFAFRAEHCYNHAQAEEIKSWMIQRRVLDRHGTHGPCVPGENPFFGMTRICL
jgi:hypothetical protein